MEVIIKRNYQIILIIPRVQQLALLETMKSNLLKLSPSCTIPCQLTFKNFSSGFFSFHFFGDFSKLNLLKLYVAPLGLSNDIWLLPQILAHPWFASFNTFNNLELEIYKFSGRNLKIIQEEISTFQVEIQKKFRQKSINMYSERNPNISQK